MRLALLTVLLSVPTMAFAQDDDRAFELFNNGRDLYNEGRYEPAILAFEEAYKLSNRHELLLNIANAHERIGAIDQALEVLARYQAFASADEKDAIERRKASLEKRLADQPAPSPDPQPQPQPAAPAPAPKPSPGTPKPQKTGGSGGGGRLAIGAILLGAGAGAVGGGVAMGVVSSGAKKRAETQCTELGALNLCPGDAKKDLSTHRSLALGADIAFAAGAALVVTGVVVMVTGKKKGGKSASLQVGPDGLRGVRLTGAW